MEPDANLSRTDNNLVLGRSGYSFITERRYVELDRRPCTAHKVEMRPPTCNGGRLTFDPCTRLWSRVSRPTDSISNSIYRL